MNTLADRTAPRSILLGFLLAGASAGLARGAEDGIRWVTTSRTNAVRGSVSTWDVYLRDGQTNLVRGTTVQAGVVEMRTHRFYHAGRLLAEHVRLPESSSFTTEADAAYAVSLVFGPTRDVRSAVVGTREGVVVDAFSCTNGVFTPLPAATIREANAAGSELRQLLERRRGKGGGGAREPEAPASVRPSP